jgi:hypothetical protein
MDMNQTPKGIYFVVQPIRCNREKMVAGRIFNIYLIWGVIIFSEVAPCVE